MTVFVMPASQIRGSHHAIPTGLSSGTGRQPYGVRRLWRRRRMGAQQPVGRGSAATHEVTPKADQGPSTDRPWNNLPSKDSIWWQV